jgi:hypothetical protein
LEGQYRDGDKEMKIFKLDDKYSVVCESQSTRYGFRHVAILHKNGTEIYRTKKCYYNRTWESYEFESVLLLLVEKYFTGTDKIRYSNIINQVNPIVGI